MGIEEKSMNTENIYPYLVVRYMAAAYQRQPIAVLPNLTDSSLCEAELVQQLVVVDGEYLRSGKINVSKLHLLQHEILRRTFADGLRRCLVLGPKESYFCEPNGTVFRSITAPSGGVLLNSPPLGVGENTGGGEQ